MITVYPADCTDFSNNGLGILQPIECTIHEIAGGAYELNMVHPIDSTNRWTQITNGCFIKAPAPVRESPLYEEDATGTTEETVTRSIYSVNTSGMRLNLRQGPSMDARIIGSYKPGTEVAKLGESGAWYQVSICDGGAVGYMHGGNLRFVRDEQETITGNKPVTRQAVKVQPSRDQLFRVCSVETDSETGLMTVKALHAFYDLRGNLVNGDYTPEGIPATQVVSYVSSHLLNPSPITLHCYTTDPVTGDYGFKQAVEALLDPDEGILTKSNSLLIRDNFDAYLIPNQTRDMGVTIRRGKNLIGAVVTHDSTDIITRIIPVGKDKDGNDLFLEGTIYVDSPHINDYPTIYSVRRDYDVRVVDRDPDNVTTFISIADARAELYDLAMDEFDAGVDVPSYGIEVDFVLLSQAEGYEDYKDLQSIHMYDTVTVIDSMIGLNAKIKMTEYEWDCLAQMYNSVKLADTQSVEQTVYSYNLPTGGVSGSKISTGSLSGNALRSASIDYAKINNAAITQLTADSVAAVRATIRELVAQQITTDQLYADLAAIAVAQITTANIDHANIQWAQIQNLAAEIASVASAEIGTAKISFAKIYDLVSDTAIITEGVGGQLYINRLAVTDANVVSLTAGALMLKASNGDFVRLIADGQGGVTTETVTVEGDNIAAATIPGGKLIQNTITARELNVSQIFADQALVRAIKAANIDVADLFAAQATINALDSYIIQASTIQALEGQLNVWANDKISLAIDNVQVGGRNLAAAGVNGAGVMIDTGAVVPIVDTTRYYQRSGYVYRLDPFTSTYNIVNYPDDSISVFPGTYTLSFFLWNSGTDISDIYVGTNFFSNSPYRDHYFGTFSSDGGTPKRCVATFDVTYTQKVRLRFVTSTQWTTGQVYISDVMLERGNKASDYSPAPSDTDAAIDAVSAELSLVPGKITAAVSNITMGGVNLLKNTRFLDKANYSIDGSGASATGTVTNQSDGSLLITNNNANTRLWWGYLTDVSANSTGTQPFAISFKFKNSANTVESTINIQAVAYNGSTVLGYYASNASNRTHDPKITKLSDYWQWYTWVFEPPTNTTRTRIAIRTGADYSTYTNAFYVKEFMLERGNMPSDWSEAEGELVNNSITIDTEGIKMSSSDVFQLTATNSSKNSFIDIHGLLTANNTGGLMAQDGAFQNSLAVKGQRVLTKADISVPIIVSPNQPTGDDAHNLIWLQPSSVTGVRYTGYTADSRNSTVMFTSTNRTISRNFTAEASNTLANGTFTYTLEFEVISLADVQLTGVKFSASATKSSSTVSFSESSAITLTKYQTATITLTATSTTNLATNANAISVAITATASSYGGLYLNSKQNMPLTIAKSGGSGTQGCNVYYIP